MRELNQALQPIGDGSISTLSAEETESISGGFVYIGAFAAGAAVGYGIRKGVDALVDWIFD